MKKNKLLIPFFLSFVGSLTSSCFLFKTKESVKAYKKSYRINEIRVAESNTFRKLNNVTFPGGETPTRSDINDLEKESFANFSNLTYKSILKTSKSDNLSYSTVGLYSLLNEMVGSASREDLRQDLNELLGLDEDSRVDFYKRIMLANSFAKEDSTIQLKNAAFFNNVFNYNSEFVKSLTKLYCEAYQISFINDVTKMLEWVNKAVNSDNFIDEKFLELDEETQLYLFSTFYFKNAWLYKYLEKDNFKDTFYLGNGTTKETTFMKHSFNVDSYHDYGSYISFEDYYYGANASISYLIPKNLDDNIYELTKNTNIFEENADNLVEPTEEYGMIRIELSTPKFKAQTDIDFQDSLSDLGFADIFNDDIDSFKNAFDDPALADYKVYIQKMKQRNEVEFNEDGTIIKSVSMASYGAKESAMIESDTLEISLNQPFIYIIKDVNKTPIFVGHVDNPKF